LINFARSREIEVAIKIPLGHTVGKVPVASDHPSVQAIAAKHSKSPMQILARWSYQHGFWTFPTTAEEASPGEMGDFREMYRGIMHPLANRPKHCSSTKVYMFHLGADDMQSIDGLVKEHVIISSAK
jgi:diketogulonate reductase-like aldo/keto reductase